MKRIALLAIITTIAFCNGYSALTSNRFVCRDSILNPADTTFIRPGSVRSDSFFGHLYGDADSLGSNPWTSYLRSDVADTATGPYIFKKNLRLGGGVNDSSFGISGYYSWLLTVGSKYGNERIFNLLGTRYDTTKAPMSYLGYEDWPDTSRIVIVGGADKHPLPNQIYFFNTSLYSTETGIEGLFWMPMKIAPNGAVVIRPQITFDSIIGGFNLYNPTDRKLEVYGGSYFDKINVGSATPGIGQPDGIYGHLYGTADTLGGNPWTSYLRSDVADTATGKIRFNDTTFQATGKPVMFGAVSLKDTLTGTIRAKRTWVDTSSISSGSFTYNSGNASILVSGANFEISANQLLLGTLTSASNAINFYGAGLQRMYGSNANTILAISTIGDKGLFIADSMAATGTDTTVTGWRFKKRSIVSKGVGAFLQTDTLIANKEARADSIKALKGLFVMGSDTAKITHSGDTTHFSTTAEVIRFNKETSSPKTHAWIYFADSSKTISVTQDSFSAINGGLFTTGENEGFTIAGDSIIILKKGSYKIDFSFTFTALNGKDFSVRMAYDTTGLAGRMSQTTTGTTNYTNIASTAYKDNADSGHVFKPQVTCRTDGTDPIFKDGMIFIHKLY